MKPLLERLPPGGRVAVVRLRSLGDCVLTTPALQILKNARPDLRSRRRRRTAIRRCIRRQPERRHASAAGHLLHCSVASGPGHQPPWRDAKHRPDAGVARQVSRGIPSLPRSLGYNILLPRAQEILGVDRAVHTAEHLASAMFYLGAPSRKSPAPACSRLPGRDPAPYAIIHPFASSPAKTWPAERFVAVARHLRDHGDLDP